MAGSSSGKLIQELILYSASAAVSMGVLFVGLRRLDPDRESSKRAIESRKQLSKRLGRTLSYTTPFKVYNSSNFHFYVQFIFSKANLPLVLRLCAFYNFACIRIFGESLVSENKKVTSGVKCIRGLKKLSTIRMKCAQIEYSGSVDSCADPD